MAVLYARINDLVHDDLRSISTRAALPVATVVEVLAAIMAGREHPHAKAVRAAGLSLRKDRNNA